MRPFFKLIWVQFKLFMREPVALFFTLAFPALILLLFGSMYGNTPDAGFWGREIGMVDASVPAYAGIIIGTVALMSIPIETSANRENGVLRRYRTTPLHPAVYLAATFTVYLAVALIGMLVLIVEGKLVFHLHSPQSWMVVLGAYLLCTLAFFAFGFLIASLAPNARLAQILGMVIFFPMLYLSGAGMPLQLLPAGLQKVSDYLPMTYVVRLIQGAWFGDPWRVLWQPALVLAAILIVGTLVSSLVFRWE